MDTFFLPLLFLPSYLPTLSLFATIRSTALLRFFNSFLENYNNRLDLSDSTSRLLDFNNLMVVSFTTEIRFRSFVNQSIASNLAILTVIMRLLPRRFYVAVNQCSNTKGSSVTPRYPSCRPFFSILFDRVLGRIFGFITTWRLPLDWRN
jgi:hypothetical protein